MFIAAEIGRMIMTGDATATRSMNVGTFLFDTNGSIPNIRKISRLQSMRA
jgi:hypothetical protein